MHYLQKAPSSLLDLFDKSTPAMPMLYAILEGRGPADILVDDPDHPTQCLVRSRAGVTFASLGMGQVFFDQALAQLRTSGGAALVRSPNVLEGFTPPTADAIIERLEFSELDADTGGFRALLDKPLAGMSLRALDAQNVQDCLWVDALLAFCGSLEGFLKHGFGFSLYRGEGILAEGYAPVLGCGTMEIGVMTAQAHRGQGLATRVSAHVIKECLLRDWSVAWSCELDNPASAAIARKLGFRAERTYPVALYRSTKI